MTSQPEAKYCPGTNHRVYAWRARQRNALRLLPLASGMGLEEKFVTARAVTD